MNDQIFQIIGRITYSYNRIDFLLSHFGEKLGVVDNRIEFLGELTFKSKVDRLIEAIRSRSGELKEVSDYIGWFDVLDKLRLERNVLTHSIVLQNSDDKNQLKFYNYRTQKRSKSVIRTIKDYTIEDLEKLDKAFIACHNEGWLLYDRIK